MWKKSNYHSMVSGQLKAPLIKKRVYKALIKIKKKKRKNKEYKD